MNNLKGEGMSKVVICHNCKKSTSQCVFYNGKFYCGPCSPKKQTKAEKIIYDNLYDQREIDQNDY